MKGSCPHSQLLIKRTFTLDNIWTHAMGSGSLTCPAKPVCSPGVLISKTLHAVLHVLNRARFALDEKLYWASFLRCTGFKNWPHGLNRDWKISTFLVKLITFSPPSKNVLLVMYFVVGSLVLYLFFVFILDHKAVCPFLFLCLPMYIKKTTYQVFPLNEAVFWVLVNINQDNLHWGQQWYISETGAVKISSEERDTIGAEPKQILNTAESLISTFHKHLLFVKSWVAGLGKVGLEWKLWQHEC